MITIDFLAFLSGALIVTFLAVTVLNLFTSRRVRVDSQAECSASVELLIPMRNEAANVDSLIANLVSQSGLEQLKITALDDQSTDETAIRLAAHKDSRFHWIAGNELPSGWLGKNYAAHQLAMQSTSEFLVFIDADVRFSNRAIASALAVMQRHQLDFLSPYPRQIAITWLERLVQPLLQWSWFVSVPLWIAERFPNPATVVANGQFFIVRAEAYRASGGHAAIKGEVLDDLELARSLIRHGYKGAVADGSEVAYCRMYHSAQELIAGYSKSQWRAFGNLFGSAIMIFLLFASSILPFVLALLGSPLGWIGFTLVVLTRVVVAIRTRSVISTAWLHPISALIWIGLILNSWIQKRRGGLVWKDRQL